MFKSLGKAGSNLQVNAAPASDKPAALPACQATSLASFAGPLPNQVFSSPMPTQTYLAKLQPLPQTWQDHCPSKLQVHYPSKPTKLQPWRRRVGKWGVLEHESPTGSRHGEPKDLEA